MLPVLLLAAAALTGTLVRRMNGTASRAAFLFGFLACLFLAPIPLISGPFFSVWAAGLIFGITVFGLAAVAVLFALYCLAVLGTRRPTWPLAGFVGSAAAFILPAHVVIALLALVGVGSVWAIRIVRSLLATHRLPAVSPSGGARSSQRSSPSSRPSPGACSRTMAWRWRRCAAERSPRSTRHGAIRWPS